MVETTALRDLLAVIALLDTTEQDLLRDAHIHLHETHDTDHGQGRLEEHSLMTIGGVVDHPHLEQDLVYLPVVRHHLCVRTAAYLAPHLDLLTDRRRESLAMVTSNRLPVQLGMGTIVHLPVAHHDHLALARLHLLVLPAIELLLPDPGVVVIGLIIPEKITPTLL